MGRKRLVRAVWALSLLLAACAKAPLGDVPGFDAGLTCEDRDHDGFGRGCERGYDCNDDDPRSTSECRACTQPERGCECSPGEGPVSCFLDDKPLEEGDVLCSEGTRHCRAGVWSGCEDVHQYIANASKAPDTQRVVDGTAGKLRCSVCDVKCFQVVDNLLSDGGVAGGNVTFGPGGGITLLPGDGGVGGVGGDAGGSGLTGCAAMMACCSTLADPLKTACQAVAMGGNDGTCNLHRPAYCPSGTVSGPVPGCVLGMGSDTDCDGIPNAVDSFPGSPIATSSNQAIFHQLDIGETGANTMNISFKLRNADVYFLMDMTNTMKEERDNLISSLTTGNVINCAHLNQCCNRQGDATKKTACLKWMTDNTNKAGTADPQAACLAQQPTYCPGGSVVDCPDGDGNGLPDNFLKNQGVVGATRCLVGSSWFGAGFSRELPVRDDPAGCTGSGNCSTKYADRDEQLFKNVIDLTSDYSKVATALQSMTTDGNWDEPEGGLMALYSVITGKGHYFGINRPSIAPRVAATACPPNSFGYPCFRKDSVPIIVFFTDRPHHNGPPLSCVSYPNGCPYDTLGKNTSTWTSGAAESSSDKVARFVPLSAETFSTAYNAGDVRGQYLTMVGDTRFMAGDYPTPIIGCGAASDAPEALIRFRVSAPAGVVGTIAPIPVNFHLTKDDAYADSMYGYWDLDYRANDPTPATEFGSVLSVFRGVPNTVTSAIDLGDRQAFAISSGPDSTYLTYTGTTMGPGSAPGFLGGISDCAADGLTNQVLFTFRPTANARIIVDASQSSFPAVVSLHSGLPSSLPKNPNVTDGTSATIANTNDTFATANAVPSGSTTIDGAYIERTGDSNVAAIQADYTKELTRELKAVRTNGSNTLTDVSSTQGLHVGQELSSDLDWSASPVHVESFGTDTVKLSAAWLGTTDLAPTSVLFKDSLVGCGVDLTGRDTVFKFDVATPRRVRIDTEGSTYDTVISLHDAPPPTFVMKDDVGSNGTVPGYSIGDVYNTSYELTDKGVGTNSLGNNYDYGQCTADKSAKDGVFKFTLSKPTHVQLEADAVSWNPIVGLFSSPPGAAVVKDNSANGNDRLTGVFDLGDIYGAVDTTVENSDLSSMNDDWQTSVVNCGATAPSRDQIYKFTPLENTRARIMARSVGGAWNPIVAVFDDPPPSSSLITTSTAFDAAAVTLPDTNCLAYSFHDPAAAVPAHTYTVCPTKRYSNDANTACVNAGLGYLASINSAAEQAFLMKTSLPTYTTSIFHIGGVDPDGDGIFAWRDGTGLSYTNWLLGEPNGMAINNKCADINALGTWLDGKCSSASTADSAYYVCEDATPTVLPNEDAATAYVIPPATTQVVTGNTRRMSSDYNGAILLSACGGTISGGDAVFSITTNSGTSYPLAIDSAGSSYNVVLGLFEGSIDASHYLGCDAPAGGVLTYMLLPSRTYYVVVKGTALTPEGQYKLKFSNASSTAATGTQLSCARATTVVPTASLEVDVDANHTYYVVVDHADALLGKYQLEVHSLYRSRSEVANAEATNETGGKALALPDPYRSRVTVVDTTTAGMSADYGNMGVSGMCTTSAAAPDAVYKFTPSLSTNVTFTVKPQGTGLNNVGIGVFDGLPGTSAVEHDLVASGNLNEAATSAEVVSLTGPPQLYLGNTSSMTADVDPSVLSCNARPNGHDAVFGFQLSKSTKVEIDASGSTVTDPVINLRRSGPLSKPAQVTLENDTKQNADATPSPTPNATAAWLYYGADFTHLSAESQVPVSLSAVNDDAPPGTLQPQDLGDIAGKRFVISGGDTGPMLADYPGGWSCGGNGAAPDALYKFFSATGGTLHVKATPQSGFDAVIGLFDGASGAPRRLSDVSSLVEDTACVPTSGPKNLTNATLKSINTVVAASPNIALSCGNTSVVTNDPDGSGPLLVSFNNWCGTQPTVLLQPQPDGPELVIIVTKSLQIAAGSSLRVLGSRPVAFVVSGTANIAGQLSVSPDLTNYPGLPGAGGDYGCGSSYGGNALSSGNNSGGGGGGGFGTAGGIGGFGSSSSVAGGPAGAVRTNSTLVPLVGGCSGGDGAVGSAGGLAAGGLQISATTSIVLAAGTGSVVADGGNGISGTSGEAGGSGAASGGGILLQSPTITYLATQLNARGGSGGQGFGSPSTNGGTGAATSAGAGGAGQNSNAAAGGGGGGGGFGQVVVVGSAAVSLAPCTVATNEAASSAWPIMLDGSGREYIERGNTSTMASDHGGMCGTPVGSPDAVYAFTLSAPATVQVDALTSAAGTVVGLYDAAKLKPSPVPTPLANDDRTAADAHPVPTPDVASNWLAYSGDFVGLSANGQPQSTVDNTGNINEIIPTELPDPIDRRVTVLNANTSAMTADYLAASCNMPAADTARDAIYRFVPTKGGPVRVSANYSQTLFNPVIALYRGAQNVIDERVTLVNFNQSTLARLNPDVTTIKVYNAARTVQYPSADYTVLVRDASTPVTIKRTTGSGIPSNSVVSVDYVFDSGAPLPVSQQQLTQLSTGNTNENAATAVQVPIQSGRAYLYTGDTTAMSADVDNALWSCGPPALAARDATFDFSLASTTAVSISTEGSSFDTTIALFSNDYTRPSTSSLQSPAAYSTQLYDVQRVPGAPEPSCSPFDSSGSRFWICSTARPWGQAEGMCTAVGLHLATIDNSGENSALLAQIQPTTLSHHIGFAETQPYTDSWGAWTSGGGGSPGLPVSGNLVQWATNEPNGSGDCLQLLSDGTWDDTDCATARPYVCERSDATVVAAPSASCGSLVPYGGHGYFACTDKQDWAAANARCTAASMRLARADDLPENDQLRALLAGTAGWIGGSDSVEEGKWIWTDSAGFWDVTSYRNWVTGEPNQPTTNPGSRMLPDTGQWVDTPATTGPFPYICENPIIPSSQPTPPTQSSPEIVDVFSARRQFTGSTQGVSSTVAYSIPTSGCVSAGAAPDAVFAVQLTYRTTLSVDLTGSFSGSLVALFKAATDSQGYIDAGNKCGLGASAGPQLTATVDPGQYYVVITGTSAASSGVYNVKFSAQTTDAAAFSMRNDTATDAHNNPLGKLDGKWLVKKVDMAGLLPTVGAVTQFDMGTGTDSNDVSVQALGAINQNQVVVTNASTGDLAADFPGASCNATANGPDALYSFTAPDADPIQVRFTPSGWSGNVVVYDGQPLTTADAPNPQLSLAPSYANETPVSAQNTAIGKPQAWLGNLTMMANDVPAAAFNQSFNAGSGSPTSCNADSAGSDAFFKFTTGSVAQNVEISSAGSAIAHTIALWDDKPFSKPSSTTLEYDSRSLALANPLGGADIDDAWVVARGNMTNLKPYNGYTTITETSDYPRNDTVHDLGNVSGKEIVTVNASTTGLVGDFLATTMQCGGSSDTSADAIFQFVHSATGKVRLSLNNPTPGFAPKLALFRGAAPQTASQINPAQIAVPNTNEATTSAFMANDPAAAVIYTGSTAAMMPNYPGSTFTQGTAYGSHVCTADGAGKDAYIKFTVPGSTAKNVEISTLAATFDQTIALFDSTPIVAPTTIGAMSYEDRSTAFTNTIGNIDNDWVIKSTTMSGLYPAALTPTPLTSSSTPAVNNNDEVQDLTAITPANKRITFTPATSGLAGDYTAGAGGAVTCGTSSSAPDLIYKVRASTNTKIRAAVNNPSAPAISTAIAVLDGSTGHPKRIVDTTPATASSSLCTSAFNYTPSNFVLGAGAGQVAFSSAPTVTLNCTSNLIYNSSTNVWTNYCAGQTKPTPVSVSQAGGGADLVILPFKSLTLANGTNIAIQGSKGVVFAVEGNANIGGAITANANVATAYAGGNSYCSTGSAAGGNGDSSILEKAGAGGGSFGTKGGNGGDGGILTTPGSSGAVRGAASTPLMSGCNGGNGPSCSSAGGAGGGVIQITAGGAVNVTGTLQANGGTASCAGSGGGSGGAIFLEGNTVDTTGATIQALGGAGAAISSAGGGSGATSSVDVGNAGGTFLTNGGGGGGGYGRFFTRTVTCKGANEDATAVLATPVPIGLTQTFSAPSMGMANNLTNSPTTVWGGGSCTPDASGPDAFWTFTLTRSTNVEIKSGSSDYNHTLTLFTAAKAPIQCLNVDASATTTNITRTLAAGTYYVGIKSRNLNVGGRFTISFRDTLAGATTATSMGCSVNGYVDADLIAGTDYYIIVKGATGTLAPSPNVVITDIGAVQANTCGDPSTADAYFDFSVNDTAGRTVTIALNESGKLDGSFQLMRDDGTLNNSSADTVMDSGCYTSSHTYTGLAKGRYYVILRAASLTGQSLPAEISIKDESGANALDCVQANSGSAGTIQALLAPGTYYAGITSRNGASGNTYKLQIRDTALTPPAGGTWVGCADSNLDLTVDIPPADGAVPYFAVIKGASGTVAGAYTLTATDLSSVQDTCATGDTIQMDATAPNAYFAFNVTDADGGGRDVTVSLASTSALDGAYRLFRVNSPTVRTPIGSCHDRAAAFTYADLAPGSYYVALRGKNVASGAANGTYELSVNDQDAYGSLLCKNGTATTGTTITRTLSANSTYWVGIKPQPGQSNPRDYRLQFRDTVAPEPVNATEIACGTGVVKANVTAGKTYYVLVKGATPAAKGPYGLALTDLGGSADWNCNDDSGAGDAYFEFNVDDPAGRRVTIDTESSALDTVLAIFPLGATFGSAGKLACDDNSGATLGSSKITRDLAPGVYYAVVRPRLGAANPILPFEISFRDESIYSALACGATSGAGKAQIRTTLAPGTYHTVLKGMSGSAQGAYKIRFRDETPYANAASEVACNDVQNELVYNVTAGKPYYAVVKGATASDAGAYRLTVENVVARNGMGCNANASSPDAVYRFHLSADTRVQIDTLGSQTGGGSPVATDTVMALYDASASFFGTNYALDRLNAQVNCDDNSGDSAKGWSKIVADLAGNRDYYVVVQSKNTGWGGPTTLPYVVNVKDLSSNEPIACASANSSLLVTEPLPAGDYRVVVSNSNGPSGGAPFGLTFRNVTAASSGATQVACADTPEEFTYNVVAGRPYYLMVKGDSASDRGQYGLVVETSGTGANSMGCGANPTAPDAFFKFQLPAQGRVTIDTEGSSADTVIALYSANTTVFGTNYALNVDGVEIPCDDDGGVSAGASLIDAELSPGSYYVVVKGKTLGWNQTTAPFNLSIRDLSNSGSIACASDIEGAKQIVETLPAGDYQVVMSTRSAAGGAYALKFRDAALTTTENGKSVACITGGSLTVNQLKGGHEYYVVVKGNTATDSGGYTLTMEDTVSLAAASSSTSVACAADNMTIDGTFPAGTYYALVTGDSNGAGGPYTLKVRDADAIEDQNRLACDDNGGPNLTSVIERDLAAGTHYVVVKGNGEEARGAYRLHVRDTASVPDRELVCAGADEAQRVQADVKAGQDYTVVLKGEASSATGNYDIKLYDQLGLQAGSGQNLKCLADPQPVPLVSKDWHRKSVDFDLNLTPDTYYVAVKGQKAADRGTFQLNIGEKSARTTTTYTPPTWSEIQDALATSGARVLPVIATIGDPKPTWAAAAEAQAQVIAKTSNAKRKDNSAIWQKIQSDGTGTGSGLITGIAEIADYLAMDVSLVAVDGPDPGASKFRINVAPVNTAACDKHPLVDTSTGVCTPQPGNPAGHSCNTQYQCVPGSAPKFNVTFTNPSDSPVPVNTNDAYGGYHFKLQIFGDNKYLLDEVPVYIIPTTRMAMGPPSGSGLFRTTGVYTQDVLTAECPKLSSETGAVVTNDLPQWSDLFFNADLPEGTSIDFELCTKEVKDDLKDCVWSSSAAGSRKKVTVRANGICTSDAECQDVPDYGDGFCNSGACQFISEPKVNWDIACADNTMCRSGPLGAGEFAIVRHCETTRGAYGYGHCVYASQPADLGATLPIGEQGQAFARIRFTLHADKAGTVAPTLYQWNLRYSCKSAQ